MEKMNKNKKHTTKKALTRNQQKIEASQHATIESNAMGEHIENNDVQNADNLAMHATMQTNENPEDAMEIDRTIEDVDVNQTMKKKTRGPTKVKRLPSDSMSRIEVEFNALVEPIGVGSVKLSSYVGPLVRAHVSFTLEDWRLLSDELKVVLWESIQARFKLDEEWQKASIFHQMGCIFRRSKSKFVKKIRDAKTKEERLQLKPDNIKSANEWKGFVESKTSTGFKIRSEKFKNIRGKQIAHTCSRKGMARLAEDLKTQSADPSSASRFEVWINSRTRKNGEPVTVKVADTIQEIKKVGIESNFSSTHNVKEDVITQVLGRDKSGQLRAMGRSVTLTKVALSHARDKQVAQCQNRISELEQLVHSFMKNQGEESRKEQSTYQPSKHSETGVNCDLLHWNGNDKIVAKGRIVSIDPNEFFNEVHLGRNAMKIWIGHPIKLDAFLLLPSPGLVRIGNVKDEIVAWPDNRVVTHTVEKFEKANMSTTSSNESKCKLYDWGESGELVAEGRVYSNDSNQIINGILLGPNAMIVWVDYPIKQETFLWRPIVGMTCIGEAVGKKIAWPESKLVFEKVNITTSSTTMTNDATYPTTVNSVVNAKCKLFDVHGTGKIVAEGTVSSSDPNIMVHSVPLGKNSLRVWIDIVKVSDAPLWRPTSFMGSISDVVGSTVAWPTAYVKMDSISGSCCEYRSSQG